MRKIHCLQAAHACEPGTFWEAGRRQRILGSKGWHIQLQEEDGRRGESSPEVLMISTLVHCGFVLDLSLPSLLIPECPSPYSVATLLPLHSLHSQP